MILNESLHLILFKGLFISKVFHLTLGPRSVTQIVVLVDFRDVLLQGLEAPAANGCGGELGINQELQFEKGDLEISWDLLT